MAEVSQIRVKGTLYDIKDAVARLALGSPSTAATAAAMTDTSKIYVYTGSESGYTSGNWYYYNGSSWVSGGVYNSAAVETDTSLSVSGAPADAKVTGDAINNIVYVGTEASDSHTQVLVSPNSQEIELVTHTEFDSEISDLKSQIESGAGFDVTAKTALLDLLAKATYGDTSWQTSYNILHDALFPPASLVSISAVYTQSGTVYETTALDDLKNDLVVTAHYDDSTEAEVSDYTLSGTLTYGTSTVTVTYGEQTTTFDVTVSDNKIRVTNVTYPYTAPTSLSKRALSQATVQGKQYVFHANLTMASGSSLRVNVSNTNSVWFTITESDMDASGNVAKQFSCGKYNAGSDIYFRSTNGTVVINDCYFVEAES